MFHSFLQSKDRDTFAAFKKYRNQLKAELKRAKIEYYERLFTNIRNDPKKIWNEINNLRGGHTVWSCLNIMTTTGLKTGYDAVCSLNMHFASAIAPDERCDESESPIYSASQIANSVSLTPVTPNEIRENIMNIQNNVASGFDDLKAVPIKHVSDIISPILAVIVNRTFETGIFPDQLKIARICPVHKGGCEKELNNYRPISILPVLSKVFERAINTRLENFFSKFNIISNVQFGFQKGKSTEAALLSIKHDIIQNFESRMYTLGLFVDLRKAFDSVCHDVLLSKLQTYGVRGVVLKLIESYLTDRCQYVSVCGVTSDQIKMKRGVPQGSILGPLLFLIYVNDFCSIPYTPKVIMYADDTNIFFTARSLFELENMVNMYLNQLSEWLTLNKLQLNSDKTKYIIFAPINKPKKLWRRDYFSRCETKTRKATKIFGCLVSGKSFMERSR